MSPELFWVVPVGDEQITERFQRLAAAPPQDVARPYGQDQPGRGDRDQRAERDGLQSSAQEPVGREAEPAIEQ